VIMLRATDKTMTCAEFQDALPELFETQADLSGHEHLKNCENCAALVRDLQYIASQARLLLPIHDPSPAVWNHIQQAIRQEKPEPPAAARK
jgi:predicted anti-sigma-YlaC factor YlaD